MPQTHPLSRPVSLKALFRGSPGYVHYLFAFVFLIRLVVLTRLTSSPFLLPNESDMHFYDDWAKQILHGRFTDHQAFYGLPLYPYLVALLYRLLGSSPFVPGFFQAFLDAGTAALIFKITIQTLRGERTTEPCLQPNRAANFIGVAAAAAWAFFVPAQAYSAILMPSSVSVFVFWLLVWLVLRSAFAPSLRQCLAFGALIGFGAMGVATLLLLSPLVIAALFIKPLPGSPVRSPLPFRSAALALFFAGIAVGTSPCWIHNYVVARDPVFLSAHGGINLWLGNNPEATGYPRFPGLHAGQAELLRDSIDLAERAAGRSLKRSEASQYWSSKARDYITSNPRAWLKLMIRKVANFWNAFEYDDLGVIRNLREYRVLFPGLHFGLVAALAFPGLLFSWRAFPASRWIATAVGLHVVGILPVFVTERYRLPVVPGLLILAALGLYQLWRNCSLGKYRNVALQLGVVAASALLVTWPRHDPSLWGLEAYNSGRLALDLNDLPLAEQQLLRAHAFVPDNTETNFALGNLRLAQGKRAEAKSFYEIALRLNPKHKGALNNLALLELEEERPALALEYLRRALEQHPQEAKTFYLLAKAYLALEDFPNARIAIERALERDRDRAEYHQLQEEIVRRAHE
jgi:Tetratricopeptide repeat